MAVADAVISFAVEKIGDMILQKAISLYGLSSRVEQLGTELIRMRCFLKDAELKKQQDSRISNWVAEIRDIANDAEDVLEIYALKLASEANTCFPTCGLRRNNPIFLRKVGSEIGTIADRLTNLTARLPTYGLVELKDEVRPRSSLNEKSLRHTYSHKIERNVVGLEKDAELLLALLVQRTDCRVVSICGMGGLGKTTLAKKVYHRCKDRHDFDFFFWVSVTQKWGKRNIWETLLRGLISPSEECLRDGKVKKDFEKEWEKIQKMEDGGVAKKLHEELLKTKCLVVLDDIWDNVWDALSPAFPSPEETSCKFMITTRNKELAKVYIHEPSCLNYADSWELFTKTAIPTHGNNFTPADYRMDESMEKLGSEMVKHCGGLPLAIVVLGGLLSTKTTYDEWDTVHRCIKSYLKGEGFGITQILALSYDDLPYELKPCFLYLGVLPEDFEISRDRLINLWVAEGIIHQPRVERDGEEALEDIAYRYLTELAQRYMIVVAKRDPFGRIKKCQMHDLMRDFCLSKSEMENYFQVLPIYGRQTSLNLSSDTATVGRARRLSLHLNNVPKDVALKLKCEEYPPFRSILGFSLDGHSGINQGLIEDMVRSFKLVRILDLEKVLGFCIPKTIGRLIHLRLLNLRSAWVGTLPLSMGNLSRLLTLRLDPFQSAKTIPNFFPKLKRLRHLYLPSEPGSHTKQLEFEHCTDLRTLVNFPTSNADVDDLIKLTKLRKLKIILSGGADHLSFRKLKAIFESPDITFNYLRDFSIISDGVNLQSQVDNIKSRCPRLLRLKVNHRLVYQKTKALQT